MIINGLPARFKLLPIVILAFSLLLSYFYFFDGGTIDTYYRNHVTDGSSAPAAAAAALAIEETTPFQAGGGQHMAAADAKADQSPATGVIKQSTAYTDTDPVNSHSSSSIDNDHDSKIEDEEEDSDSSHSSSGSSQLDNSADKTDSSFAPNPDYMNGANVKKGTVVMVTASHGTKKFQSIPNLKNMVYENRRTYAHMHGYEFMWADITAYNISNDTPLYWNKIPVIREAFQRFPHAEWVWWMDLDIIIMNSSLSMWDHVLSPDAMKREVVLGEMLKKPGGGDSGWHTPSSYDYNETYFMISSGGWGMNVGNFLLRRSSWTDWLLNIWIDPLYIKAKWPFPENDAWTHMYRSFPIVRQHTVCTNQLALNAYPDYNPLGKHWQPGGHTVHFAGCGGDAKCPERWDVYWNLREEVDVPQFVTQRIEDGTAEIESFRMGEGLPAS